MAYLEEILEFSKKELFDVPKIFSSWLPNNYKKEEIKTLKKHIVQKINYFDKVLTLTEENEDIDEEIKEFEQETEYYFNRLNYLYNEFFSNENITLNNCGLISTETFDEFAKKCESSQNLELQLKSIDDSNIDEKLKCYNEKLFKTKIKKEKSNFSYDDKNGIKIVLSNNQEIINNQEYDLFLSNEKKLGLFEINIYGILSIISFLNERPEFEEKFNYNHLKNLNKKKPFLFGSFSYQSKKSMKYNVFEKIFIKPKFLFEDELIKTFAEHSKKKYEKYLLHVGINPKLLKYNYLD